MSICTLSQSETVNKISCGVCLLDVQRKDARSCTDLASASTHLCDFGICAECAWRGWSENSLSTPTDALLACPACSGEWRVGAFVELARRISPSALKCPKMESSIEEAVESGKASRVECAMACMINAQIASRCEQAIKSAQATEAELAAARFLRVMREIIHIARVLSAEADAQSNDFITANAGDALFLALPPQNVPETAAPLPSATRFGAFLAADEDAPPYAHLQTALIAPLVAIAAVEFRADKKSEFQPFPRTFEIGPQSDESNETRAARSMEMTSRMFHGDLARDATAQNSAVRAKWLKQRKDAICKAFSTKTSYAASMISNASELEKILCEAFLPDLAELPRIGKDQTLRVLVAPGQPLANAQIVAFKAPRDVGPYVAEDCFSKNSEAFYSEGGQMPPFAYAKFMTESDQTPPFFALSKFSKRAFQKDKNIVPAANDRAVQFACMIARCNGRVSLASSNIHFYPQCGVCSAPHCANCHEAIVVAPLIKNLVLPEAQKHKCNEDTLASMRTIANIARPCPGCLVQTERQSGCDYMSCTQCHTSWYYSTGQKVSYSYATPRATVRSRNISLRKVPKRVSFKNFVLNKRCGPNWNAPGRLPLSESANDGFTNEDHWDLVLRQARLEAKARLERGAADDWWLEWLADVAAREADAAKFVDAPNKVGDIYMLAAKVGGRQMLLELVNMFTVGFAILQNRILKHSHDLEESFWSRTAFVHHLAGILPLSFLIERASAWHRRVLALQCAYVAMSAFADDLHRLMQCEAPALLVALGTEKIMSARLEDLPGFGELVSKANREFDSLVRTFRFTFLPSARNPNFTAPCFLSDAQRPLVEKATDETCSALAWKSIFSLAESSIDELCGTTHVWSLKNQHGEDAQRPATGAGQNAVHIRSI